MFDLTRAISWDVRSTLHLYKPEVRCFCRKVMVVLMFSWFRFQGESITTGKNLVCLGGLGKWQFCIDNKFNDWFQFGCKNPSTVSNLTPQAPELTAILVGSKQFGLCFANPLRKKLPLTLAFI